jgi:heme oxygenase
MKLLSALREGTTHLHGNLDRLVSERPLASRDGYVRFLSMHARVIPAIERWLLKAPEFSGLPLFQERMRSEVLAEDLKALGHALPSPVPMSFLNAKSSVAGICYVVEGSRLGAAHLCTLLDRAGADFPTAFLRHGHGRGFWRSFLAWLAEQDHSSAATERATLSARQLFGAYLGVLEMHDDDRK